MSGNIPTTPTAGERRNKESALEVFTSGFLEFYIQKPPGICDSAPPGITRALIPGAENRATLFEM